MSTYICANCKGEFERVVSEEEALAECKREFGIDNKDEVEIVCDECYEKLMHWYKQNCVNQ